LLVEIASVQLIRLQQVPAVATPGDRQHGRGNKTWDCAVGQAR